MNDTVLNVTPLTAPWSGFDPFLFCAYHLDHYPTSDGDQGVPAQHLSGRPLGSDFSGQDGFSMYHSERVPGFPVHPHRGFETVTFVRRGYVDHADSLGATSRYGAGDVQWLTTGKGVQHAEMFPLLDNSEGNTLELFQIWLNLPARNKFAEPEFKILWAEQVPVWRQVDPQDEQAINEVTVIAGAFKPANEAAVIPPSPPQNSWAAADENKVAIWAIRLSPGQRLTLPAETEVDVARMLYVYGGNALRVGEQQLAGKTQIELLATAATEIENTGDSLLEIILMQARPIGEPIAAHGPFVMNTDAELHQAFADYRRTEFGGWPWPSNGPVHPADSGRFARHPGSSTIERPPAD
jgi:redox-sensitive bicupin YhaK (pirin superfamily)